MASTNATVRQQLIDPLAQAADGLADALASLAEAYEQLDEQQADRLEADLFRPAQRALGRTKRTYSEFVARHTLEGRELHDAPPPPPASGVKALVGRAIEAIEQVDAELAGLQDSLVLVDLGDPELRGGLAEVRRSLDGLPASAHAFLRTFGR